MSQNAAAGEAAAAGGHRALRALARVPVILRAAAACVLPAVAVCACATTAASATPPSPSRTPSVSPTRAPSSSRAPSRSHKPPRPRKPSRSGISSASPRPEPSKALSPPPGSAAAGSCQRTFVPAFFYDNGPWTQAIDTKPTPGVLFLNVDSGPGTAPDPHFQALVRQAQAAGITVLGYSSTSYGQRPVAAVETEVREYTAWYGVNGMFLDLTQGTPGELSYYRTLASYIRATVPNAVIWLNPGTYPDPSFMSVANVVMVFEGSFASYLSDQVPGWISHYQPDQFAHVLYATPQSDFARAISLSRARRAGYLYVTDRPGTGNPYGAMPSYWVQEAATVARRC
jgi:Spherulation-specific family 4